MLGGLKKLFDGAQQINPEDVAKFASDQCVSKYIKEHINSTPKFLRRDLELIVKDCKTFENAQQLLKALEPATENKP